MDDSRFGISEGHYYSTIEHGVVCRFDKEKDKCTKDPRGRGTIKRPTTT